jgi:hypothetical protein
MSKSKALPPAPFILVMSKIRTKGVQVDPQQLSEAYECWPNGVDKVGDRDMTGCVENIGFDCEFPRFLGVHFPKVSTIFNQIRKSKGIEPKSKCMPLNYEWINKEMLILLEDIGREPRLKAPFLISEVLTKELLNFKIYVNVIKRTH